MPLPLADAVDDLAALAATKSRSATDSGRYLLSSALAGAYVGVAVVLLLSVSAPLAAAGSPFTKLVQGSVFGVALTLVVFAGAELFTGNAMFLVQGLYRRTVRSRQLATVWTVSLVGNLVGSVLFAGMVHAGGTLAGDAPRALLAGIAEAKATAGGGQLFWRAVLCNLLVCLALWMAARATSDGAKLGVLWWALLAFIASGFEHSVANMTVFGLAVLDGSATWMDLARNLAWTVPGNVVGGGIIAGLGYAWLAGSRPVEDPPVIQPAVPALAGAAPD